MYQCVSLSKKVDVKHRKSACMCSSHAMRRWCFPGCVPSRSPFRDSGALLLRLYGFTLHNPYIALFLRHRQQEKVFGGRKTGVLAEVNGFTGAFDCSNSAPTAPKKIGAFLALRSSFMRKSTLQNCGLCNSQFSATQPPNESYLCLTRTRDVPGFSLARVVCMAPAGLK